jgi:hypothetical protein
MNVAALSDSRVAPKLRARLETSEIGLAQIDLAEAELLFDPSDEVGKLDAIRRINAIKLRISELEKEAKTYELQIGYMTPPNGKSWCDLAMLLENDRRIANLILQSSGDEQEIRLAKIRLEGDDLKEAAFNTKLAGYKARLKAIRGR